MSEPLDLDLLASVIDLIDQRGIAPRSAMEPHSLLESELGISAFDQVNLRNVIAVQFGVYVEFFAALKWVTIADIVRHLQARQVPA